MNPTTKRMISYLTCVGGFSKRTANEMIYIFDQGLLDEDTHKLMKRIEKVCLIEPDLDNQRDGVIQPHNAHLLNRWHLTISKGM